MGGCGLSACGRGTGASWCWWSPWRIATRPCVDPSPLPLGHQYFVITPQDSLLRHCFSVQVAAVLPEGVKLRSIKSRVEELDGPLPECDALICNLVLHHVPRHHRPMNTTPYATPRERGMESRSRRNTNTSSPSASTSPISGIRRLRELQEVQQGTE